MLIDSATHAVERAGVPDGGVPYAAGQDDLRAAIAALRARHSGESGPAGAKATVRSG